MKTSDIFKVCALMLTGFYPFYTQSLIAKSPTKPESAYYRYTNAQGAQEVGRQVPPGSVDAGYEILDKRMRVIEVVQPAPTAAEIKVLAQEKAQALSDDALLKTFTSVEDALRARDRKISALDVIVTISESNILRMNLEYETLAANAANKQRKGEKVSEQMIENMVSIERQLQEAQMHIQAKEIEKQKIYDAYQPDIDRLREIEGLAKEE